MSAATSSSSSTLMTTTGFPSPTSSLSQGDQDHLAWMMRNHPRFTEILQTYSSCKRPVTHDIAALDLSEKVLLDEFPTGQNMLPGLAPKVSEEPGNTLNFKTGGGKKAMDEFLDKALIVLKHQRAEIVSNISVRDDTTGRYFRFIHQEWDFLKTPRAYKRKEREEAKIKKFDDEEIAHLGPLDPLDEGSVSKRRINWPPHVVKHLKTWFVTNLKRPYPTEAHKAQLATETGLTAIQVNNWFINARKRIWLPLLEKSYGKEAVQKYFLEDRSAGTLCAMQANTDDDDDDNDGNDNNGANDNNGGNNNVDGNDDGAKAAAVPESRPTTTTNTTATAAATTTTTPAPSKRRKSASASAAAAAVSTAKSAATTTTPAAATAAAATPTNNTNNNNTPNKK